jgi:hypothetical protein
MAMGETTTPPTTSPEAGRQNSLMKPSSIPAIFARALPLSGSMTDRAGTRPDSTSTCDAPTVASSGSVNTLAETVFSRSGETASPNACHMAIRPCIAATEARSSTPVQSPAA